VLLYQAQSVTGTRL